MIKVYITIDTEYSAARQCRLVEYGMSVLMAAGSLRPVALRAGNYGANDETLKVLAFLGLKFDTSHAPANSRSLCDISLCSTDRSPVFHHGVIEVPIGCIGGYGGQLRHAQVTAITASKARDRLQRRRQVSADPQAASWRRVCS